MRQWKSLVPAVHLHSPAASCFPHPPSPPRGDNEETDLLPAPPQQASTALAVRLVGCDGHVRAYAPPVTARELMQEHPRVPHRRAAHRGENPGRGDGRGAAAQGGLIPAARAPVSLCPLLRLPHPRCYCSPPPLPPRPARTPPPAARSSSTARHQARCRSSSPRS
jgi:hypothetical protein